MAEERIYFFSDDVKLEGLLEISPGHRGVVISHPHPLYGGNMDSAVVECLARSYQRAGYTTLRFNFRGAGNSGGGYDHGKGEQQDVKAALARISAEGKTVIDLAGYSFGAWVNALMRPSEDTVQRIVMIAPPVAFLDYGSVTLVPQLELVIAGSRDQIAPPELIRGMLPKWNPDAHLQIVEGADHFYGGYIAELEAIMTAFLQEQ